MRMGFRGMAAFWVLAVCGALVPARADDTDSDLVRFFTDICLSEQLSTNPAPYQRCGGPVTVAFMSGSDAIQDRFRQRGAYLNAVLEPTGVRLVFNKTPNIANFLVYIGSPQEMDLPVENMMYIMGGYDRRTFDSHRGVYTQRPVYVCRARFTSTYQINGGVLYLNPAAYTDDQMDRAILRLFIATLGPWGHSTVYPQSSFLDGYIHHGTGNTLNAFDEAVLRFALKDLPPGVKQADLSRIVAGRSDALLAALASVKDVPAQPEPPAATP